MAIDEARVKRAGERAFVNEKSSGCAQSVLLVLQEELGIGNLQSFKAATVLAGGVARRGETCGAVIGALMALGIEMGRERMEDVEQYRRTIPHALKIIEDFQRGIKQHYDSPYKFKTTLCKDVQAMVLGRSYNLLDPVEQQAARAAGSHGDNGCPRVCAVAAEVATRRILELRETAG